tara:strand:+ start:638 stop:1276 length:639 start_codon:yes stop_codon:yes gene_type:complete
MTLTFSPAKFEKNYLSTKLFTWRELGALINNPHMTAVGKLRIPALPGPNSFRPPWMVRDWVKQQLCCFENMSRATKKINDFAKKLEEEYPNAGPSDAHIYTTRKLDKFVHPFGAHFDKNENVIVQCEGKTNFKVWEKVLCVENGEEGAKGTNNMDLKKLGDPILDCDMEPGDAIWIPKEYPHLATPLTEKRMGISFSLSKSNPHVEREWVKL